MAPILSTPNDFYLSRQALVYSLNALGRHDYLNVSVYAGAKMSAYIKDIIGYTPAYEYRRWTVNAYPTCFDDSDKRYVHIAAQRDGSEATIVYSQHRLDIYGRRVTDDGEHFLDADGNILAEEPPYIGLDYCFYIGTITSSAGDKPREWEDPSSMPYTGRLDTDEFRDDATKELYARIEALESMWELRPLDHQIERQAVDADGNLLYIGDDGEPTISPTDDDGNPRQPYMVLEDAFYIFGKHHGVATDGFMSAFGLPSDGSDSGEGDTPGEGEGEGGGETPGGGGGGGKPDVDYFTLGTRTIHLGDVVSLSDIGIPEWAQKESWDFSDLPDMYWADQRVSGSPVFDATPTIKALTLRDGDHSVTLSIDPSSGALQIDGNAFATGWFAAFGRDGNSSSDAPSADVVPYGRWDASTWVDGKAANAKEVFERINALAGMKPATDYFTVTNKHNASHKVTLGDTVSLSQLGIPEWAQDSSLQFSSLPSMYWANIEVSASRNFATVPTFQSVRIGTESNYVTLSMDADGNFHIDRATYSDSWMSAFGKNASAESGGVSLVQVKDWTAARDFPNNLALPADFGWDLHTRLQSIESGNGNYLTESFLTTWAGSTSITTVGTITAGTWNGNKISNEYLVNNKVTLWGNEISLGGTTAKGAGESNIILKDALLCTEVNTALNHAIKLGYNGTDSMHFYEIGGLFQWHKHAVAQNTDAVLMELSSTALKVQGVSIYLGNEKARIWYDEQNNCLHTNIGIVSDSFVSAFGKSDSSSSGSGANLVTVDSWTTARDFPHTLALPADFGWNLHTRVLSLEANPGGVTSFGGAKEAIEISDETTSGWVKFSMDGQKLRAKLNDDIYVQSRKISIVPDGSGTIPTDYIKGSGITKATLSPTASSIDVLLRHSNVNYTLCTLPAAETGRAGLMSSSQLALLNQHTTDINAKLDKTSLVFSNIPGKIAFSQLPTLWWGSVQVAQSQNLATTPQFATIKTTGKATLNSASIDTTLTVTGESTFNDLVNVTNSKNVVIQGGYITSELANTYHSIKLGFNGTNQTVFSEHGGVFHFMNHTSSENTIIAKIRPSGINANRYYFAADSDAAYLYYDSTNKCLRTNVGFASDSFVSAFGINNTSDAAMAKLATIKTAMSQYASAFNSTTQALNVGELTNLFRNIYKIL